jgi:uncharacterized protein YjlB
MDWCRRRGARAALENRVAPRAEIELADRLGREGWVAEPWSTGARHSYAPHRHGYDKVLVVAAGSISFGLPATGNRIELAVGDRLDLPSGTEHDALVGDAGVTCLEAHAPPGTLAPEVRARGRGW